MRVLIHGRAWHTDQSAIARYEGPHELRSICGYAQWPYPADYRYDAAHDDIHVVLERLEPEWPPDLLLCWLPEDTPPPYGIEDCPIPTAAIVSDWNLFYPKLALNLARYDVVLCDLPGVEVLRSDYVAPHYLFPPYAQITGVHQRHDVPRDLDVVYVGGLNAAVRPERARFLERLAKLSRQYNVLIATNYTGAEYARLLSRARLAFNHSVRGELNLRVFETFACGAAAMIEADNPEAQRWFEDGREVIFYSAANFETVIAHYLAHPEAAKAVAARGHARAAEFAGENRFDALIAFCAAQGFGPRRFRELGPAEQAYHTLLGYSYSLYAEAQARERELAGRYPRAHGESARAWTAVGRYLFNPFRRFADEAAVAGPCIEAFAKAYEAAQDSAPYAMNWATACRRFGDETAEGAALEAVLETETLDGAEAVVGRYDEPFMAQWLRALALGQTCAGALHAEACIRLGMLDARHGRLDAAASRFEQAEALEPHNAGGTVVWAKTLWELGRRNEAVDLLERRLPHLPLDMTARETLAAMLRASGAAEAAQALDTENRRLCETARIKPLE